MKRDFLELDSVEYQLLKIIKRMPYSDKTTLLSALDKYQSSNLNQ